MKLPFYMEFGGYNNIATINLVRWVKSGYNGNKLRSPAINFLFVHTIIGITVLMLYAATLLSARYRRKWGHISYLFTILLGVQSLPAAQAHRFALVFATDCYVIILVSFWGFYTLWTYDKNPKKAEKHLAIQHHIICVGAWGAGFAELFLGILPNLMNHIFRGIWPPANFKGPHPEAGLTIYDRFPESLGWITGITIVVICWVVWPMYAIDASDKPSIEDHSTESTPIESSPQESTPLESAPTLASEIHDKDNVKFEENEQVDHSNSTNDAGAYRIEEHSESNADNVWPRPPSSAEDKEAQVSSDKIKKTGSGYRLGMFFGFNSVVGNKAQAEGSNENGEGDNGEDDNEDDNDEEDGPYSAGP